MLRKIALGFILSLSLTNAAFAAQKVSAEDRVIGATFKTLAKAYVATTDIEKLKAKKIHRIEIMREDWFDEKYAEVYQVIRELPPKLQMKYGVTEGMTKERTIRIIRTLDKKALYEIIDNVPDTVIAEQFAQQFHKEEPSEAQLGLKDRIARAWERCVIMINKGTASSEAKDQKR